MPSVCQMRAESLNISLIYNLLQTLIMLIYQGFYGFVHLKLYPPFHHGKEEVTSSSLVGSSRHKRRCRAISHELRMALFLLSFVPRAKTRAKIMHTCANIIMPILSFSAIHQIYWPLHDPLFGAHVHKCSWSFLCRHVPNAPQSL